MTNTLSKYNVLMFVLVSAVFFLNISHMSEQGIYQNVYTPLANSIIEDFSYRRLDLVSDTYPMWGYPALLALSERLFGTNLVLYLQYFLVLVSLSMYLNRVASNSIKNKTIGSVLFMFYVMVLSVKWPDAILAFFLMQFVFAHNSKQYLFAALLLGAAYNFRSEALAFLLVYIVFMAINHRNIKATVGLALLLPWVVFQYHNHQEFIPTSTNSGGVLFITLGQLPGNNWDIKHLDSSAYKEVERATQGGVLDPWGRDGNKILKERFYENIKTKPFEYVKKISYNLVSVIVGGFYTIEPHYLLMDGEQSRSLVKLYKSNMYSFVKDVTTLSPNALVLLFSGVLKIISVVILAYSLFRIFSNYAGRPSFNNIFFILIFLQILICVLIQYQPRHMSHVVGLFIPLLLNLTMSNTQNIRC